jgi:hypothetical protein
LTPLEFQPASPRPGKITTSTWNLSFGFPQPDKNVDFLFLKPETRD